MKYTKIHKASLMTGQVCKIKFFYSILFSIGCRSLPFWFGTLKTGMDFAETGMNSRN